MESEFIHDLIALNSSTFFDQYSLIKFNHKIVLCTFETILFVDATFVDRNYEFDGKLREICTYTYSYIYSRGP